MNIKKNCLLAVFLSIVLGGCSVIPGSHISTYNKKNIDNEEHSDTKEQVSDVVNLIPLTAKTLSTYQSNLSVISARSNLELDVQLADYEYQVGPGDILNVTIWDHPELTIPAGSYRSASEAGNWVHADGSIFYPYVGKVDVSGKSVREIRDELSARLARFIENPQVDVSVADFRSQKAYVTGEVKVPGQQFITNIPMTVLDAINAAGGLSSDADWRNVTLTRKGNEQHISLYALMQRGDLSQNQLLESGDIIHVPRNDSQKVFVMGEVNDPQMLKIDRSGMSLTEALSSVGGINELSADATGVFVIRISSDKASHLADIYQLNVKDASAFVIGTEFYLKPYDIVYVTAAPLTRWNRVVNLLVPTISGFNELTEGMLRVRNWP